MCENKKKTFVNNTPQIYYAVFQNRLRNLLSTVSSVNIKSKTGNSEQKKTEE